MSRAMKQARGRVVADLSKCQGYANCVMVDPQRFDLDSGNQVAILRNPVEPGEEDLVQEAVRACPTQALRIEDC
jgi:ferredoxin